MRGFETSLGLQDLITLPGTRALLIAERNFTLDIRSNFREFVPGTQISLPEGHAELLDSGHMLGSAQVMCEHADGYRTGYSGDFAWPVEEVIEVDELVLDSTYGSPDRQRTYSQEDAEDALRTRVMEKVGQGPVYIYAHRGTLQRAMCALAELTQFPVLVSDKQMKEALVYQRFGFGIGSLIDARSPEGSAAQAEGRFVLLEGRGDRPEMNRPVGYSMRLTAMFSRLDDPILEIDQDSCQVAMTNHADFAGTLAYVQESRASRVLTDNVRGPKGVELAQALRERLGIDARPGSPITSGSREWGS